jgi:hypothetical protein
MWTREHTVESTGTPQDVWALYADVAGRKRWDEGIEEIQAHGPFAVGTVVTMTPAGQDPVDMTITDLVEPERFTDETAFGPVTIRFVHLLDPVVVGDEVTGTRITHRVEVEGPGEAEIGPAVADDLPEAMAALAALSSR